MKISELRAREEYDANLRTTLQACIAFDAHHAGIDASSQEITRWYEHPFFSVYTTPSFCADGRRYLNAMYRHAPRVYRRPVQALATDILTTGPVFRQMLKYALDLPTIDRPQYQMWMPGNHRFRRFNFETRTIRVYPKNGFSKDGIRRELALRRQFSSQFNWILPVIEADEANAVFDEPLMDAQPLNRISNVQHRQRILAQLPAILEELHRCEASVVSGDTYLTIKRKQWEAACAALSAKFPGIRFNLLEQVWQRAARVIAPAESIDLSLTHGDFQPGNCIVPTHANNSSIWLIDWEDVQVRASIYDAMTWHLSTRAPHGLHQRLADFIHPNAQTPFNMTCAPTLAAALWAIEEWIWLLESSSRPGISHLPQGLCQHFKECEAYLRLSN